MISQDVITLLERVEDFKEDTNQILPMVTHLMDLIRDQKQEVSRHEAMPAVGKTIFIIWQDQRVRAFTQLGVANGELVVIK